MSINNKIYHALFRIVDECETHVISITCKTKEYMEEKIKKLIIESCDDVNKKICKKLQNISLNDIELSFEPDDDDYEHNYIDEEDTLVNYSFNGFEINNKFYDRHKALSCWNQTFFQCKISFDRSIEIKFDNKNDLEKADKDEFNIVKDDPKNKKVASGYVKRYNVFQDEKYLDNIANSKSGDNDLITYVQCITGT
jgi:hypothetical protein